MFSDSEQLDSQTVELTMLQDFSFDWSVWLLVVKRWMIQGTQMLVKSAPLSFPLARFQWLQTRKGRLKKLTIISSDSSGK